MAKSNAHLRRCEEFISRILLSIYGFFYLKKKPPSKPIGRILLCKTCCLGDAVLTLYAIRAFKYQYPDIELHVLASRRVENVYVQSSLITQVHTLPLTGRNLVQELLQISFWVNLMRTFIRLRQLEFTQYIDFELYRSYGSFVKTLLGIPFSRGFSVTGAPDKFHDLNIERQRNIPEWECFYALLGLNIPTEKPAPIYFPLKKSMPLKRLGIVFGSSFNWPQKKWPRENFATAIQQLGLIYPDLEIIIFGVPSENEDGKWIETHTSSILRIQNTVGQLHFNGLIEMLSTCDAVFGNDTGTMHVAAACGIPTFTLFGPTRPLKWNPLTSIPIFIDLPCRPCYYLGSMPDCNHFSCLKQLKPEIVVAQIEKFFGKKSVSC